MPLTGHVDRNYKIKLNTFDCMVSCPSRGTWIEMVSISSLSHKLAVVPLTGHVDRNVLDTMRKFGESVVPLTGHVDRNYGHGVRRSLGSRRAPHGARG